MLLDNNNFLFLENQVCLKSQNSIQEKERIPKLITETDLFDKCFGPCSSSSISISKLTTDSFAQPITNDTFDLFTKQIYTKFSEQKQEYEILMKKILDIQNSAGEKTFVRYKLFYFIY